MGRKTIDDMLATFGKHAGIPDLALEDSGYTCLIFDEVVCNIEVDEDSDLLFLYANVGDVPTSDREAFYESLLQANFFYRETLGATLGIDKETGIVALVYRTPITGLDYQKFEKTLENFVNLVESWTRDLSGAPGPKPPPSKGGVAPGLRV